MLCMWDAGTHTYIYIYICANATRAGRITPAQAISYNFSPQPPKVGEPGCWWELGTLQDSSTRSWGPCFSWPCCSHGPAAANLHTLQNHTWAHVGPISTKSACKSPNSQKQNHIQGSYLLFLMATLNHKGFKYAENKFQLIKSHKAVGFEEVWF